MTPGRSFVYYRGRLRSAVRTEPQQYICSGTIGAVGESKEDLLRCDIEYFYLFPVPFYFKSDGVYL